MRINNSLRTAFLMVTAFAGVSFAATDASAEVAGGSSNSSIGSAALRYEHTKSLTPDGIGTGWLSQDVVFGVSVHAQAVVHIDPVKDGGPLFIVDMPKGAIVEASWSNDKKITLKAQNGSTSDGQVKVRHSLSPDVEVNVAQSSLAKWDPANNKFGFNVWNYDATEFLNTFPGAKFDYDSQAVQAFAPWGFTKVDTVLNAPLLAQTLLFSKPFAKTISGYDFAGTIGLRAVTNPIFAYKTTKVTLSGSSAITSTGGETVIDAFDGDYLEKTVTAEGTMDVTGTLDAEPVVTITKAFGYNINTPISFDLYKKDYTVPTIPIAYNAVTVHIPLPNVKAPKAAVALGNVRAGASASKTVTITNTGEKAAVMTMTSSDPQFSVPSGQITIEPKGSYEATIDFSPDAAGAAEATITVLSNDPDEPEQTFSISANGGGTSGDSETDSADASAADSGCGCKTAGGTSSLPSWAGFGLLGLGALVLGSRRNRK